jgi:hypothetical protein
VKFRDDARDMMTLLDPSRLKLELFEVIGTKLEKFSDNVYGSHPRF